MGIVGDDPLRVDELLGQRVGEPIGFGVDVTGERERSAEVLILGDSFTNIYAQASLGWGTAAGLAEHLSAALGRPVDRIVQNDQGAHATRELLARQIAESPDRLDGVRVVVYQFATRELSVGDWRIVDLGN